jgi:putative transposase
MSAFGTKQTFVKALEIHAAVYNLFNLGRHLVSASNYQDLRQGAFASWKKIALV